MADPRIAVRQRQRTRPRLTRLLVVLASLAALLAADVGAAGPPAAAATRRTLVAGWLPGWDLTTGLAAVTAHSTAVSDVSPFWFTARASSGGAVAVSGSPGKARRLAVIKQLKAQGARVIPSVADGSSPRAMAKVLASKTNRARHVAALIRLVQSEGYDGLELDYEKFAFSDGTGTWATTRPNWLAFLSELSAKLHARGKILAVAAPPMYNGLRNSTSGYWVYDYAGMAAYVDSLRIMTYDYSVSTPGPIAPTSFVRRTLAYATTAFPADRIRMGLPSYGRLWVARKANGARAITGRCPAGTPTATWSFTNAKAAAFLASRNGGKAPTVRYDTTANEAVAVFARTFKGRTSAGKKTSCKVTYTAWWVNARGVQSRLGLVSSYGLAGVAIWHLGGVDRATWKVLGGQASAKPAKAPATVTVAASPARPTAHRTVTFTARVGEVASGTTVALDRKAVGAAAYAQVRTTKVSPRGYAVFRVPVVTSASFRVRVPATPGRAGATRSVSLAVAPQVRAAVSTTRPGPGSVVRIAVSVSPAVKGMAVRRQVWRGGKWVTLATTQTNAKGRASFSVKWPKVRTSNTYRIVTSKKGSVPVGGTSAKFTVRSR